MTDIATSRTRTWFRTIAIAEAISWAGLLIAMIFKWVVQADPHSGIQGGVPIMGPIHGGVFVAYVVTCLSVCSKFGWSAKTTALALASSIPPLFTYVFEVLADKRGLLGKSSATS
ncbi:MAG: DUF3817 domain-containing protein [Kineosporiaceae bacterium]|nr:DUF3817 domain-containing protein [Aeromicrobium sp.]